jgi:hypothetical protein
VSKYNRSENVARERGVGYWWPDFGSRRQTLRYGQVGGAVSYQRFIASVDTERKPRRNVCQEGESNDDGLHDWRLVIRAGKEKVALGGRDRLGY